MAVPSPTDPQDLPKARQIRPELRLRIFGTDDAKAVTKLSCRPRGGMKFGPVVPLYEVGPVSNAKTQDLLPYRTRLIHRALRHVARLCDGAVSRDGIGFNKLDAAFGNQLARQSELTPRQAASAKRLLRKYWRQIPQQLYRQLFEGEVA